MCSVPRLRSAAAAVVLVLALQAPVGAAEPDLAGFKAEIDAFIARLGPSSNGVVRWAGSDPYEIRRDGDALVAIINNARLSFETQPPGRLTLDRFEIRQTSQRDDGGLIELALLLPREMTLTEADGGEAKITLSEGRAHAVIEAQSGRGRETAIEIARVRIDQPKTGAWLSVGPLSISSKLVAEPNGSWRAPVDIEAREIAYSLPQAQFDGSIDRIAFSGSSAGPELKQLDKLRHAIEAMQSDDTRSPQARAADFLAILPTIAAPFGMIRGEFALDGLAVRNPAGENLASMSKAAATVEISGLATEKAAIRFSIRHEGLDLAPSVFDPGEMPHRVVFDLGLTDLSTLAFTKLLRAAGTMAAGDETGEHPGQEKRQAMAQMLGAAAELRPTFHIYDLAVDTADVGVDLTAQAHGSPLTLKDYSAAGDLVVRGFDAIPKLSAGIPFPEYLPVLKELGIEKKAPDGTPQVEFHLASAPPKWITINGNDVDAWFEGTQQNPGQPRLLKPSDPPMKGSDVRSVQRALTAARISVAQDGVYNSDTAVAVARFQKEQRLNVSGVVDPATRERLGFLPREGGRN